MTICSVKIMNFRTNVRMVKFRAAEIIDLFSINRQKIVSIKIIDKIAIRCKDSVLQYSIIY